MRLGWFWAELQRRGVARAAATYLVTSWLILEVGHLLSLILEMPHVAMRFVLWLLVITFPIAMVLAWNYRTMARSMGDVELPESEPASRAEHNIHEAHEGGHGGHGHGGVGGFDPLPFIVGGGVVAALLFLGMSRLMGVDPSAGHAEPAAHDAVTTGVVVAAGEHKPAAVPKAAANSIAVLAFANLSGDPRQEYFSDGLSEELIDALARITQLQVAARTSSFAFKGKATSAATIGASLGAAWLLDGSVRRDGDAIRVSAQLVDARTGFRSWSQTYDRQVKDIFAVQRDIADAVAGALQVKLVGGAPKVAATGGTGNQVAYDAYLRGRQLVDLSGSEAQWREALAQFDAAIAADPAYALAHAARARALIALGAAFLPATELPANRDAALASARRAVALTPDLADAQSTLGFVLANGKLDFRAASSPFLKSMQTGNGSADTLIRYGIFACRGGDVESGLTALRKAVALDPLNPRAHRSLAIGLYAAARYADAIVSMRRGLSLSPKMTLANSVIGDSELALGNIAGARADYASEPVEWARLTGLAVVAARAGKPAEARALLAQLTGLRDDTSLYQAAQVLAQLGDAGGALAQLERARTVGDTGMVSLRFDPMLDPLRGEPRFQALVSAQFGSR